MRIGLIGAGRWGRRYIETLAKLSGAELAHVGSANPDTARIVPGACRISADWRVVATDASLDGVILASPPASHAPLALAAIDARLPVLIEKPMALNVQDANAIAAAARGKRVLVIVGHTHLFSPAYRALKLRGAVLGKLRSTRSRAGNRGPVRTDANVLWDWGPHDVAMCIDLFGTTPAKIVAASIGARQLPEGRGEAIELGLDFGAGRQSDIKISNIEDAKQRLFEASYANGRLVYDDLAEHKLIERRRSNDHSEPVSLDPTPPLTILLQEFIDSIGSSADAHPSLALGVQVVEVLSRCEAALCG